MYTFYSFILNSLSIFYNQLKEKEIQKQMNAVTKLYAALSFASVINKSDTFNRIINHRQFLFNNFCLKEKERSRWLSELKNAMLIDQKEVQLALINISKNLDIETLRYQQSISARHYEDCVGYAT